MPSCCAYGCSHRSDSQGIQDRSHPSLKRTYHKFPNDPERQKQWLVNVRRDDFAPTKYSTLCSDHFEEWCFDRTGNNVRLRETAVPTIFSFSLKSKNPRKRALGVGEPVHKKMIKVSSKRIMKKERNKHHDFLHKNVESPTQKKSFRLQIKQEENCKSQNSDETILNMHVEDNKTSVMYDGITEENVDSISSSFPLESPTAGNSNSVIMKTDRESGNAVDPQFKNKGPAKDKIIYLADNRTYFEFATPKKKVILQLKPPKSVPSDLKTQNLEELINSLKSRQLITSDTEALLEAFGELPRDLERLTASDQKFCKELTEEVKKFASVLYIFSPKALDLLDTVFRLPDKKALQARLKVRDYWPGFTQESLNILKKKIPKNHADKICSIMIDTVDLRKQHSYDSCSGKWIGHVEFGGGQDTCDSDEIPLASEILMFTAVGIGSNWKLPFGYFLNRGLGGEDLHSLVLEAFLVLEKCGLNVRALVCDGSGSTVKMGKLLGCNIHTKLSSEMITSFPHPSNQQQKVHLVFGFQRAFKLLKDLLADKGTLRSSIYGIIKWKFFRQLFGYNGESEPGDSGSTKADLHEFHDLRRTVRLCNPGFTYAASRAFELAEKEGLDEYVGSKAAANFTADLCRAFDLLNSRNPTSRDKPPLTPYFLAEQLESMSIIGQRMFDIELLSGEPVAEGGRWMSVVLLAFTLKSVANLASELLNEKGLVCLTTYRLNLDHSTLILNCVQKRGGWDGTPTAAEFRDGYKKFLTESFSIASHSEVYNNDFEGEDLAVGQGVCSSFRNPVPTYKLDGKCAARSFYIKHTDYRTDVIFAGKYIIKYISQSLSCAECVNLMLADDYSIDEIERSNVHIKPSNFIINILQMSEKFLQISRLESDQTKEEHLVMRVFREYSEQSGSLQILDVEHFNQEPFHVSCLVKVIIRTFIKFRLQFIKQFSKVKTSLLRHS